MPPKVIVTDHIFPDLDIEAEVLESVDADLVATGAETPTEIIDAGADADAMLTATHVHLPAEVFEELSHLQLVSSYGIGLDHVDVDAATRNGVPVSNVPTYCVDEVSTHTLALLLACVRKITQYDDHTASGGWDWEYAIPIQRLAGQTLGIVGFGNIGRSLAAKVQGFDLEIMAADPYLTAEKIESGGAEKVEFDDLLAQADLVSTHTPLRDSTYRLFDEEAFSKMKSDAVFVNTSRGKVVDADALYRALTSGGIAAAGIDVLPEEPPGDSPLLDLENAIVTPHVAWYSDQSIAELQRKAAEEVAHLFDGRSLQNVANPEAL